MVAFWFHGMPQLKDWTNQGLDEADLRTTKPAFVELRTDAGRNEHNRSTRFALFALGPQTQDIAGRSERAHGSKLDAHVSRFQTKPDLVSCWTLAARSLGVFKLFISGFLVLRTL